MGAWGIELFENDTALDAIYRYKESADPIALVVEECHNGEYKGTNVADSYIEMDETSDVIIQALLLIACTQGTDDFEERFKVASMVRENFETMKAKAKGLDAALKEQFPVTETEKVALVDFLLLKLDVSINNPEKSELLELWEEGGEGEAWKATVQPVIDALREVTK